MEWNDIRDPKHEFEFMMADWSLVRDQYLPDEIQKLINEKGVLGMVSHVNEHFKFLPRHGHPVMRLEHAGERKIIVQY